MLEEERAMRRKMEKEREEQRAGRIQAICCVKPPTMGYNNSIIDIIDGESVEIRNSIQERRRFEVDFAFGPENDVFPKMESLISRTVEGGNSCILTFGGNKSGKSYTLFKLIKLCVRKLFRLINEDDECPVELVGISVKGNQMSDLFHSKRGEAVWRDNLKIRKNNAGTIVVKNATALPVLDSESVIEAIRRCNDKNKEGHMIFTILVGDKKESQFGKLTFVDLHSPDDQDSPIDANLTCLAEAVSLLAAGVPLRPEKDKLLHLLSDAIGGNAKTIGIACINPDSDDYSESIRTLMFAEQLRKIVSTKNMTKFGPPSRKTKKKVKVKI
eukprot:g4888.t1